MMRTSYAARALAAAACVAVSLCAARAQVTAKKVEAVWSKLPRPRVGAAATKAAPTIDGRIGQDEWQAASRVTGFIGTDSPRWKGISGYDRAGAQTTAYVTYDATCLYVAFRCDEPEIETLQVRGVKQRDGSLWRDDCVELFLRPPGADHHFHLIVNSKGWVYDAKNSAKTKRGSAWDLAGLKVAAWVSPPREGSHWSAELALPFAGLGAAAPKAGEVWGLNLARERYAAEYKALMEYSTWSGLVGGFERPEMFGEVCFADLRQDIRLSRAFLGVNELTAELTHLGPAERKLLVEVHAAGPAGAEQIGRQTAAAAPGRRLTVKAKGRIKTEGVQMLALSVADAATGKRLSCTRVCFHVPEVMSTCVRVASRLSALAGRAEKGSEFAKGVERQRASVQAVRDEASALLKRLQGEAPTAAARQQWQALRRRAGQIEAGATFVVWTCSPYVATGPASMPPAIAPPPTLKIAAVRNETAHAAINVTNFTDRAIELQLAGTLPGQVGRCRSGLDTTVQKLAVFQPKLLGKKVKDLPEKADGLAMPLVELNGLSTFFVRPFSTRQVWATVQTRDLKAGTKRGSLRLVPLSAPLPAVAVPWELTVWDLRIDDAAPIGVFCFDYAGDYDWMASYKINLWFRGAFPNKLKLDAAGKLEPYKTDIGRVKQRMAQGARKFLFSYGYAGSFVQWAEKNKIEYMGPRFQRLFKEILSRMVSEWLAAGLTYEDFALQSIDEAHGRGVQQVIDTTPLIRQVDPKVRLAMTIMTGLDDLKKMRDHVDVWINRNGAIWGSEQAEFFAEERARGKPLWSWNMPCTPKSKPITQFRTYGWRAMKFDFDAIGFFLYFGLVYQPMRKGGGIATRHWEAWRDGVEDYQLLRLLRDEIDAAGKRGVPAAKTAASRKLLADAVDDVVGKTFFPPNTQATHDRIVAARAKAAAEILRVRKLRK